ncbi:MAG: phenylalanine--tRNA ligase subunit beta [Solirubrobacterales bacterium]
MKISLEWLKDYVDLNLPAEDLAHKLTMAGITVDTIETVNGDKILELDLTPNRGDCLGMINVAREISAVTGLPLHYPPAKPDENDEKVDDYIKVSIEDVSLCSRYTARVIKNIRIAPSPAWMQERLEKAGVRPINNIVDITNYVMLEMNQPLHAFDYDRIRGQEIIVRPARNGEILVTLDDIERELTPDMLVIADAEGAIGLAGVMGGGNSEINDETITVLLESANFSPVSIRKTAKKLGMRTDASARFERGVDPDGAAKAANRAVKLIEILGAGEVVGGVCDAYPEPQPDRRITLRIDRVNAVLGTDLSYNEIKCHLQRLQFPFERAGKVLTVTVPKYRPDLAIEEDLIEEVARLYGYDNIPSTTGNTETTIGRLTPYQKFQTRLTDLAALRLRQVLTYSFINPRWLDTLRIPEGHALRNTLQLVNPLSEEQGIMRTTIIPGLLEVAARNVARRNEDLALFELGAVFLPTGAVLPDEVLTLSGLVTGKVQAGWHGEAREMDFYYLKGILESIFKVLRTPSVSFVQDNPGHTYHPGRTARIESGGKVLGWIGEIHPQVLSAVDLKRRAYGFEINADMLMTLVPESFHVSEFSKYPVVFRDLALVVNENVAAGDLIQTLYEAGGELLKRVELFDVYRSAQLGENMKSLAFAFSFQSVEGTLQDETIAGLMQKMETAAAAKHGAKLR